MIEHVAICGMGPSRKRLNCEVVQSEGGEVFGLPWDPLSHRYDVHFEMHDRSIWETRGEEYLAQLQESPTPTLMQAEYEDIRNSVEYPLGEVIARLGRDYFACSPAYMIGYAMLCNPRRVSIWGVDYANPEQWMYEKPCLEYMIGLLIGRGVDVFVPPESTLLSFHPDIEYNGQVIHYGERYGYLPQGASEQGSARAEHTA